VTELVARVRSLSAQDRDELANLALGVLVTLVTFVGRETGLAVTRRFGSVTSDGRFAAAQVSLDNSSSF